MALNKCSISSGFIIILSTGFFCNVKSKYQETQVIVWLNLKTDSFLMWNLYTLLRYMVAVFAAIESLTNQIGTFGFNWLAVTPANFQSGCIRYWVVSLLSLQVILVNSGTAERVYDRELFLTYSLKLSYQLFFISTLVKIIVEKNKQHNIHIIAGESLCVKVLVTFSTQGRK